MEPTFDEFKKMNDHLSNLDPDDFDIHIYTSKADLINSAIKKYPGKRNWQSYFDERLTTFSENEPVIGILFHHEWQFFHVDDEHEAYEFIDKLKNKEKTNKKASH